jgi:hypothetical protein
MPRRPGANITVWISARRRFAATDAWPRIAVLTDFPSRTVSFPSASGKRDWTIALLVPDIPAKSWRRGCGIAMRSAGNSAAGSPGPNTRNVSRLMISGRLSKNCESRCRVRRYARNHYAVRDAVRPVPRVCAEPRRSGLGQGVRDLGGSLRFFDCAGQDRLLWLSEQTRGTSGSELPGAPAGFWSSMKTP